MYDINDIKLPESYEDKMEDKPGFYRKTRDIFDQLSEDEAREAVRHFLAYCTFEDELFGRLLDKLEELGEADNTIVIYTADHGELGGAHGISGKGTTGYREQNNVPFIVSHPDVKGNQRCSAVTSHLDIATTLVSLAGGTTDSEANLHGRDFSPLLRDAESAPYDAIRPGALFNYNMLAYLDADFMANISAFLREGGEPAELPNKGWRPDLSKRGAIRSVFDGRYKLSRYFSPREHHLPRSIEELFASNDVELFDLETDPHEMKNLAMERRRYGDLLLAMNDKLNALIEAEVGEDIGQMLPGGADADWTLDPSISKLRM
jgi:arylsulfatase